MKINAEWRRIIRRAWSIRFIVVAYLFSVAEVVIPYLEDSIPRGTFAALSGLSAGGAFVSRLVAQKEFD